MFWARYDVLWWAILGQVLISILLLRAGIAQFNREELLGRELDTLNLRWSWRIFKDAFFGRAHNIFEWYRHELPVTLRTMKIPLGMMTLALGVAVWIGAGQARVFPLPANLLTLDHLDEGFLQGLDSIRFFSASGITTVWLHNLRAVALATLLGIFSVGVLAVIVLMLPLMLVGYFMANLASAGFAPGLFFSTMVLPHGILEIPAMILSGAAIIRLGATMASPSNGLPIGESWLRSLAGWARVILGLVLPLLFGAAVLEVLLTPRLVLWVLGG